MWISGSWIRLWNERCARHGNPLSPLLLMVVHVLGRIVAFGVDKDLIEGGWILKILNFFML